VRLTFVSNIDSLSQGLQDLKAPVLVPAQGLDVSGNPPKKKEGWRRLDSHF